MAAAANAPTADQKAATFFDQHYDQVAPMAARLGIDPSLPLGPAAHESDWGMSRQAQQLHNPFGATPGGDKPVKFGSDAGAWDWWGQTFGPRVQGVGGDAATFLGNLQLDNRKVYGPTIGGDRKGPYNPGEAEPSQGDKDWRDKVGSSIRSVQRRLPGWLAGRAGNP
jgi:hypothetical protein